MLPVDTKPVTRGNDIVLTSKLCNQNSSVPYSTENRSNRVPKRVQHVVLNNVAIMLRWNVASASPRLNG